MDPFKFLSVDSKSFIRAILFLKKCSSDDNICKLVVKDNRATLILPDVDRYYWSTVDCQSGSDFTGVFSVGDLYKAVNPHEGQIDFEAHGTKAVKIFSKIGNNMLVLSSSDLFKEKKIENRDFSVYVDVDGGFLKKLCKVFILKDVSEWEVIDYLSNFVLSTDKRNCVFRFLSPIVNFEHIVPSEHVIKGRVFIPIRLMAIMAQYGDVRIAFNNKNIKLSSGNMFVVFPRFNYPNKLSDYLGGLVDNSKSFTVDKRKFVDALKFVKKFSRSGNISLCVKDNTISFMMGELNKSSIDILSSTADFDFQEDVNIDLFLRTAECLSDETASASNISCCYLKNGLYMYTDDKKALVSFFQGGSNAEKEGLMG